MSICHLPNYPILGFTIEFHPGDTFFVFSDGYADQFGGERGKKFKSANFKRLLISIQDQSIEQQGQSIHQAFEAWVVGHEQVDDVCVIGVRI